MERKERKDDMETYMIQTLGGRVSSSSTYLSQS
jgi:hypothetical protein